MNENTITRIQSRADTKANWEAENPLLLVNEIGYENDTKRLKMGDGNKRWNELPYYTNISNGEGENSLIQDLESLAISKNSVALGSNNTAGCKGYYYRAIDFTNKIIYLNDEQVKRPSNTPREEDIIKDFVSPQYDKGDTFSMNNVEGYYSFCGVIEKIDGNRIYYKDPLPFNTTGTKDGLKPKDYIFFVPSRPEVGSVTFTEGGSSVGGNSKASGEFSFVAGEGNIAGGDYSTALGRNTKAGYTGFTAGQKTVTTGPNAVAMGDSSRADGQTSFAFGNQAKALKDYSIAMGSNSQADAQDSTAIGKAVKSTGNNQTVLGKYNQTDSSKTFIIGNGTDEEILKNALTIDSDSNIEVLGNIKMNEGKDLVGKDSDIAIKTTKDGGAVGGVQSIATGETSFAFGYQAEAHGQGSHAEGKQTKAKGNYSHSEGDRTETYENAIAAHVEGIGNHATTSGQHVQGKYSITDEQQTYAHIVGNGTNEKRSNAHTLDWNGNAWFAGEVAVGENKDKLVTENSLSKLKEAAFYNEFNITPSNIDLFEFELNNDEMTAAISFNNSLEKDEDLAFIYDEKIVIPYEYTVQDKTYTINKIKEEGFYNCRQVPKFILPNTITTIGEGAFKDCFKISSITIPDSVTLIGNSAFAYCINLVEIVLPKDLKNINDFAFLSCDKLLYTYFEGSEAQWTNIEIGTDGNGNLINSKIMYEKASIGINDLSSTNTIIDEIRYYDKMNLKPTTNKHFKYSIGENGEAQVEIVFKYNEEKIEDFIIPYRYEGFPVTKVTITSGFVNTCILPNTVKELYLTDAQINQITIPKTIQLINCSDDLSTPGRSTIQQLYYKGSETQWNETYIENNIEKRKIIIVQNDNQLASTNIYYEQSDVTKTYIDNKIKETYKIDNKLDMSSRNPVQNTIITQNLKNIENNIKSYQYYNDINILPSYGEWLSYFTDKKTLTAKVYINDYIHNKEDNGTQSITDTLIIPYKYQDHDETYIITSITSNSSSMSFYFDTVIIPDSITTIEESAFYNSYIHNIVIPKSVKNIKSGAFYECFDIKNIYYKGSKQDWEKIIIEENNEWLTDETNIHYNYTELTEQSIEETINKKIEENKVEIDDALNNSSENPVQNKIITQKLITVDEEFNSLNQKINSLHYYGNKDIVPNVEFRWRGEQDDRFDIVQLKNYEDNGVIVLPFENIDCLVINGGVFLKNDGLTIGNATNITKLVIPRGFGFDISYLWDYIASYFPYAKKAIYIDEDGIINKITFDS